MPSLYVLLSTPASAHSLVGLPVLAGEMAETLFPKAVPVEARNGFEVQTAGRWTIGHATMRIENGRTEQVARNMYERLVEAVGGLHLCRIWNFVPRINGADANGLENYRAFCRGRSLAFEVAYGSGFKHRLPAASAVGTEDDFLTVVFAACPTAPRHFENPEQVPAYEYPPQHGPRPPSFSRATVAPDGSRADVFISGTAAIEGHETVAPRDTAAQLERTLRNLRVISKACGLGENLGVGAAASRHFKVYLRDETDLAATQKTLNGSLLRAHDKVTFLRTDICRAELTIEIEASIMGATLA